MDIRQKSRQSEDAFETTVATGLPSIELRWDEPTVRRIIRELRPEGSRCTMLTALARTAARVLHAESCAVTLVDRANVHIIGAKGIDLETVCRSKSFCDECVRSAAPLIVEEAATDPRFSDSFLVVEHGIGHFAGVPLVSSDGQAIGTICILGRGTRRFSEEENATLSDFAVSALHLLEQKRRLIEHESQRDLCQGVLDALMDGVYTLAPIRDDSGVIVDFVYTMVNARTPSLIGKPAESIVGRRLTEVVPATRTNGRLQRYIRSVESGESFREEVFYESPPLSGWFEVSAVPAAGGLVATFRNIDQRKDDENELALACERFELVSAATEDMVWDYDVASGRLWWSDNLSICLGHSKDDIEETLDWWAGLLHPEERSEVTEAFDRVFQSTDTNWSYEYRLRRADGSYATVLDRGFFIRDEQGKVVRAVGAAIDLSARLKAGKDIEFQRTILEAQAEASQDAVLVTDAGHRWFRSNQRFRDRFAGDCDHPEPYDCIRAAYEDALNSERVNERVCAAIDDPQMTIKEDIEFRDGRAFELHSEPLRDSRGSFLGRVWFVRDLTRQRESNQLLRAHNLVLEASGVVLFRWRPEPGWPVALVSRNVDQFGYTAAELLAGEINFVDLVHPDDLERVASEVTHYLESGRESFEQEYRIVCRDGSVRWIYDQTVVERDACSNVISLQGVILDISERRAVENELAASEAMLKELTAQIPGAVYQYRLRPDGSTEIPFISEGIQQICGAAPTDSRGDPELIISMILEEDQRRFQHSVVESAKTLDPWHCEFRIRHRSGAIRWISGNSVPRCEPDGSVIWHGLLADVTERKIAEETLRRTTALLERTNALAHVGGWEYDVETDRLYASAEIKRILGVVSSESLSFEQAMGFYTPESLDRIRPAVQRAIDRADSYDLELEIVTTTGEHRWVRAQGEAVRIAGKTVKLRGAFHDIHEQYLARQELARRAEELESLRDAAEAASRAKSEFIANMSHEIRTPLTAILGFAELLRTEDPVREEDRQRNGTVDTIEAAGRHLLTIINDILDLSKIEAGRMQIERAPTDLPALLHDCVQIMQARAAIKGIALHAEVAGPIPSRICTDPTRLRQIVLNLLGNAVKFTEAGTVKLRCAVDDRDRLIIDVEDTGLGIDPASHDRLFTTFSQADASVRRRHGGTGLGLAISRRCAGLMDGDVELVRSKPGEGSLFRVTLPAKPVMAAARVETIGSWNANASKEFAKDSVSLVGRILFAEDGPDNQRLIAHHLRRAGAEVDIAENGFVALDMFHAAGRRGRPYDLILTDIQMPEMDGIEFTLRLRADAVTTPIVAVTAHAMSEDRARCIEAGCDDYTTKPIDRDALLRTCAKWLETGANRSDLAA